MLEVLTALAAEEAHSESTHYMAESSPREAQGTAETQGAADIPQSPNDYTSMDDQKLKKRGKQKKKKVSSVKLGRNKDEGNLSKEHHDQDDHNHTAFVYEDFDATDAVVAVTPDL
ncbi:hypothetical protein Tco_0914632 [Tanacetum coccineum]